MIYFLVFGKVWVGATLQKSKYRLPRFLRHKFGVVPWISIYRVSKFPSFQGREEGRTKERPGTDHVTSGPMRGGSQTLLLENGCVRPDPRTSHRMLREENEGVIALLGDVYLVLVTRYCIRFLQVQVLV